jgi:hypothetical protein
MPKREVLMKRWAPVLHAALWVVSLIVTDWIVGVYFAGTTMDAWMFSLVTLLAFAVPSMLFAASARVLGLNLMTSAILVLGVLIGERFFLRHYEITEWGVLTIFNLGADIVGFLLGTVIGAAIVRSRPATTVQPPKA